MGQYFCESCDEHHESDDFPPVEFTGPTSHDGDLTCQEPADPICANCKHWEPSASRPALGDCRVMWIRLRCDPVANFIETPADFGCNRFKSKEE